MDRQKLDRWAEKLLDTGKRNNLISFKDTKASTVEVIAPDAAALFEKVDGTASLEVYDPKLAEEDDIDSLGKSEEETDTRKVDKQTYFDRYSGRLRKANQVLLYNNNMTPMTALKNIDKKAKTALEETGVNVAYMAFGFINWKEKEHSEVMMKAPILLVPVKFERESQISPYFINSTGDDIVVNPTFGFLLQAEYDIKLPEYDDEGFDAYLSKVEEIVRKLGWTVSKECKIAIFSFLKINMYRDLKDNQEAILSNQNIRMLLGEDYEPVGSGDGSDVEKCKNPLIDLHSVVDADSSQIEAIEMAKSGVSFVLQGPPGTGKSQTITNIIAECLHDGKKVLFVSEKQAALNVVYDKLKKAGLSEFCLELHSHKANKKDVIEDLCHTLRESKKTVSSKAENEIADKKRRQEQLDAYENELHKQREVVGKSLYQLFDAYSACRKVAEIDLIINDIENRDAKYLGEVVELLERYVDYTSSIGYDFRCNTWYGYKGQDSSYQTLTNIKTLLNSIVPGLEELVGLLSEVSSSFGNEAGTIEDIETLGALLRLLSSTDVITPHLLKKEVAEYTEKEYCELSFAGQKVVNLGKYLNDEFDEEIYKLDAAYNLKLLQRQFTNGFTRLFNSQYKKLVTDIRLYRKSGKKVSYKEAIDYMTALDAYNVAKATFEEKDVALKSGLGVAYKGLETDWDSTNKQLKELALLAEKEVDFGRLGELSIDEFEASKSKFESYAGRIIGIVESIKPQIEEFIGLFDNSVGDLRLVNKEALLARFEYCLNDYEKLGNWISFSSLLRDIEKYDAYNFVIYAIDNNIPVEDIPTLYKKAYYRQWIENIIQKTPVLAGFTRTAQDQTVNAFTKKDTEQFAISKAQIKAELSAKRPNTDFVANGSAVQILFREEAKKRKQKSIRNLLSETAEVVQIIKPCFLMSPLSVSTFLASDAIRFDVVVFDEASQIFPQDAVGAIYRAKQAIIVGDSKQMPPSNFFNASIDVEDDDEEVGDIADFESILDLCSTSMPQFRLKWHYRSHYEQLISFSNRNFYDNDLVTFPSSENDREGIGVDYYYVEGAFDRTSKTNRKEADFIVDLVYKNIENHPERSMGVVAFSASQADLIDKLLSKKRQEQPIYETYFKGDAAEPFFIKNLETVQGDERDIIIFSIAYGRGTDGRLLNNFGPLNRVGGERRLNVAVSRAKDNVQVVSSMHYTDIDLRGSGSQGAKLLRDYLDYAENGMVALQRSLDVNSYEDYDSEFEMEVCDFLRENGFSVDTQVGCSGFRIDLGLKIPETSNYVLAIECDGATYHSSKNARDRDRLRQEILENMGWRFYRIWSTDWFKNKKVEKERLLKAARTAIVHPTASRKPKTDNNTSEKVEEFVETVERKSLSFPPYVMGTGLRNTYSVNDFQLMVKSILRVEAPLSEEWFLQRVAPLFGRSKVTSVVREEFNRRMVGCQRNEIRRSNGFLYLNDTKYVLRGPTTTGEIRDIKNIALEELAAGIYVIMQQNIKADRLGLYKLICEQLGFSRTGQAIVERLDEAVRLLRGTVEVDGETLTWIKN